jgi:pimeloyl-ACP methyl ester carboxylesterase
VAHPSARGHRVRSRASSTVAQPSSSELTTSGSKQNWRSLAKGFAQRLGMPVYALDMRNHGMSPAATPHGYADMAADIAAFAEKAGIKSGMNLLGHSM